MPTESTAEARFSKEMKRVRQPVDAAGGYA